MALLNNEKYSLYYQRISLIYQRPEVKASLEIILSVFVVTVLIFAAIRPTLTNVAVLQKRISDLEIVNKKADNKIAQVFNAQTQLDTYKNQLVLFDRAVPNNFSYQAAAARIELLAKQNNLTVSTIALPGIRLSGSSKPDAQWASKILEKDPANIMKTDVNFTVTGNPTNVKTFLQDLENLDMVTLLESVVMSVETATTGKATTLKAAGKISFYFYSEK